MKWIEHFLSIFIYRNQTKTNGPGCRPRYVYVCGSQATYLFIPFCIIHGHFFAFSFCAVLCLRAGVCRIERFLLVLLLASIWLPIVSIYASREKKTCCIYGLFKFKYLLLLNGNGFVDFFPPIFWTTLRFPDNNFGLLKWRYVYMSERRIDYYYGCAYVIRVRVISAKISAGKNNLASFSWNLLMHKFFSL